MSWMNHGRDPALEQYFYSIDTDHSGTIDGSELQRALASCGERSDPEFVGMLLRMFGKSHGGSLSFNDFNNVVGFMRRNNEAYNRHGGRPMDLATVEREVAETNRDFPGVGAMMPMVSTLFSSMGGQSGGVTADKFMLIQTFMSVIRGFMSSGGGGAGGAAGLLGGLGGLGGLGSMLGGGLGGAALGGGLGGAALGGASAAAGGYNSSAGSGGYGSAPPQQSYGSSAPGGAPSQGYGGPQGGYGAQGTHGGSTSAPVSSGAGASAGNMNSILDQIMGANLGSGPAGGSTTTTSSYSSQPPAYGGGAQQSYGGGAQQSYGGGAQHSYGGGQQTSQQGGQALSGFQAPSGYGAPAANSNAGPAFQGVD